MTSQLNVDTIVDKAGSGGSNIKIANTSVTVAEGGSATTTTVQGLAKLFAHVNTGQGSYGDSFNTTSITDNSQGHCTVTIVNDMSSANYSATAGVTKDHDDTSGLRVVNVRAKGASSLDLEIAFVNTEGKHIAIDLESNSNGNLTVHGDLA